MATLATLAAQRWRLLICGLRHGRSVEALQQVLEELLWKVGSLIFCSCNGKIIYKQFGNIVGCDMILVGL
jgi:hypothetical protein